MIVPSVDIISGKAVQLIGGKEKVLEVDDAFSVARRFGVVAEVAVIDLDAALSQGENTALIERISRSVRCRVGGGLRSLSAATRALDAGAERIILGTQAVPEILSQLPRNRLIAAVDARDGEVVVNGWRSPTGQSILERITALREYVDGFLVTFVECEGRLQGTRLDLVAELVAAAGSARVTIAGGITTQEEIANLDALGADAQVGMALYTGKLSLADSFIATIKKSNENELTPTVVCDERGVALGLCWSNRESIRQAIEQERGVYQSRSRGLWVKGETSGNTQQLLRVDQDCDRDTLRFTVTQTGSGFCHNNTATCWGESRDFSAVEKRIIDRANNAPAQSYTARLLADPELLASKLREEADELCNARTRSEVTHEAADLIYFSLVRLQQKGCSLADVEDELAYRMKKLIRRPGNAKS